MALRRVPLTLGTQSNPGRYGYDGSARLINCYAEGRGKEGRAEFPLYAIDGLRSFSTLTGGAAVRAMLAVDSFLYVVAGRQVFQVDGAGTATAIGGLASDGAVYMARNRRSPNPQIAIVCDGTAKIIENGVLSDITTSNLPPPSCVACLDGYMIYGVSNGRMFASGVDDAATVEALDYTVAESNPDGIVSLAVRGRELVAFGTESLEFWSNTGETNFPLSRAQATTTGCLAGRTVATVDQTLAFVAHDGTVRALEGYGATIISNPAVNRFIADTTDKTTLQATAWSQRGHTFYALSSPSGTWVCDFSADQQWHERKSYGLDRWRVSFTERFGDRVVAGHYNAGTLYEIDVATFKEGDDPIEMDVRLMLNGFPYRATVAKVDVDVIPGVGLNSSATDESDPTMQISSSEDHEVFGPERIRPLGTINQKQMVVDAWRFGQVRQTGRTFRFTSNSPVVRGFMGAWASIERER